ncbi:MAG: CHASE2 domain-containing protein [Gemmatimonadaceae bacterium]
MKSRHAIGLGFAASLATLVAASYAESFLQRIDLRIYDTVLSAAPIGDGTLPGVAVIAVDDASLTSVGRWPWPRTELARLVDTLFARGATVLALDLLVSEPDRPNGALRSSALAPNDSSLARAMRGGRVILGHALTFNGPQLLTTLPCASAPLPVVRIAGAADGSPDAGLFQPTGAICSLDGLTRAAGASGFLNAGPDPDGILRRVPLIAKVGEDIYPSLALAAVLRAREAADLSLRFSSSGDLTLGIDGRVIPLDAQGTKLVPYRGRSGTVLQFSAAAALDGRLPPEALRGRAVFVGATAVGLGDVVATPLDVTFPGVEVHATVAASLLDGQFISIPSWSRALVLIIALLAGPAMAALILWRNLMSGGLATLLVAGGGLVASLVAMSARGVFVSPLLPTLSTLVALVVMLLVRARGERETAVAERLRREQTQRFALQSLTALVEIRDQSTGLHARRTAAYAKLLASRLRNSPRYREYLTDEALAVITELAPLHDIGKVGVSDAVLNKAGPLTEEEYAQMREHPEMGYQTILRAQQNAGLDIETGESVLQIAKEIVRSHHERWDGLGYPRKLAGEEIPIPARIMALVDVYDALVQSRVYRPAMTHEQARTLVSQGRGTRFDPDVVDAFLAVEDEFARLTTRFLDVSAQV